MTTEYGKANGQNVYLYTLTNKNGMVVKITNFGAIITEIHVPDRNGKMGDVVLGFDSLAPYLGNDPYFGCIAGRYANRIAKGKFNLDGQTYTLAVNNGNNHLHGGIKGFNQVVWIGRIVEDTASVGVALNYQSKDGEEGYPGTLHSLVTYTLNDKNELKIDIQAVTDKATPVNLCNHTYFNLACADTNILGHSLQIEASRYTEVNSELIPTGNLPAVAGTPMDFLSPHLVGEKISQVPGGYDHNFVLDHKSGTLDKVAVLADPASGRQVEILTTQPGIQFYSGNFLDGTITGKGGKVYKQHWGLCLETQHFPDSPNQPAFPNTILRPGEKFQEITVFRFSTVK